MAWMWILVILFGFSRGVTIEMFIGVVTMIISAADMAATAISDDDYDHDDDIDDDIDDDDTATATATFQVVVDVIDVGIDVIRFLSAMAA
jgi:hypothetical protein